jgi:hypothetical protein
MNSGELIRPLDEPTDVPVSFDWDTSLADALVRRIELRQQMWRVKQRELELLAAKNFLLPRLDAVASYRVEGLGEDLIGRWQPFESSLREVATFDNYEAQAGVQLNIPIGYRREMAGVRHAELNLARERAILADQEHLVSQRLADAIASLSATHGSIELLSERRNAAEQVVAARAVQFETGKIAIDALLESQRRRAEAELQYYQARVNHILAIRDVHLQKGTLLTYNGLYLEEGPSTGPDGETLRSRSRWQPKYVDYRMAKPGLVSLGAFDPTIEDSGVELSPAPELSAPFDRQPTPTPAGPTPAERLPSVPLKTQEKGRSDSIERLPLPQANPDDFQVPLESFNLDESHETPE